MKLQRFIIFCLCLLPLVFILYGAFSNTLGVNPVETMNRSMGDWALYFLMMTLSVTPLKHLTGWARPVRFRRMLGLYTFFYACVHFLTYIWFDHYFNWLDIVEDIIKRPFITVGFISLLLLLPLAITSNRLMIKKLKKNWLRLHKLVYLIAILVIIHFFWMTKVDYYQPLIFCVVLSLFLASMMIIAFKK